MAAPGSRPLSPHLQIWRWGPGMVSSILHRVTGVGATVGLVLLLWWLGALVSGPESYAKFIELFWGPNDWHILLKIVVVGCSWALISHALTGLRHFVLDTGAGFELKANNLWATVTTLAGIVLTAAFWAVLLLR